MSFNKKKVILSACYALFLLLLLEIISRGYWSLRKDAPFFSPTRYFYYPELGDIERIKINNNDKCFDILLLGGSVLNRKWGNISHLFLEKVTYATKQKIRVHNLSEPGHTSRDSYFKYRNLFDKKFDLVLIYHGINDLRLNNCPPHIYKADYSHYSWYKVINRFEKEKNIIPIAFPYAFYYWFTRIEERLSPSPRYIPRKPPTKEWSTYGKNIKSADSFRENLKKIINMGRQKQEPIMLMTFCFYVPKDYSLERFKNKLLDYCLHDSPIEIWGTPENVIAGINAHNEIIRDLGTHSDNIIFIDQNALFPKKGQYFNDICHFTHKGCEKFVDNILDVVKNLI